MYLTKYHIDIRSQAGRQLLSSDRQELHHIIMGCVFGETAKTHHILFRAEGENLYIQSDVRQSIIQKGSRSYTPKTATCLFRGFRRATSSASISWPCL